MKNNLFSRNILTLTLLALLLSACATQPVANTPIPPEPLTGAADRTAVMAADGWEELDPTAYQPDPDAIAMIKNHSQDLEVLLFLGTWCGDSKREVPHFFQVMDEAGIREEQLTMIALDRSKQDEEGLTDTWQIAYVPTFIFLEDGQEIGRIVERPMTSLEADLATFLASD